MVTRKELSAMLKEIQKEGISLEERRKIEMEINGPLEHSMENFDINGSSPPRFYDNQWTDMYAFQKMNPTPPPYLALQTLDDLLKRDEQREKDGFPKKIRVGKVVKPTSDGNKQVIVVPTTTEEKFFHDPGIDDYSEEGGAGGDDFSSGGTGEEGEGEIIGESPLYQEGMGEGTGAGEGDGGEHDIETSTHEFGEIITRNFKLPNLKDKGKKRALKGYKYEVTGRRPRSGVILDVSETIKKILAKNFALGRVEDVSDLDLTKLVVDEEDITYRSLAREKEYESQALVFLARDYSGSMGGDPTRVVVTQHVFIHSWLTYQYNKRVKERFILHDTKAKEVPDFETYAKLNVAGGTMVHTAFDLINEIVEKENLAKDYNIFVAYGTDGDDWGTSSDKMISGLNKMLTYANRVGVTVVHNGWSSGATTVEQKLTSSGLLEKSPNLIRMDVMDASAGEERIFESIGKLFSEKKVD
jgi:uncharacterized protein